MANKILIIIPAYNEEKNIEQLLINIERHLGKIAHNILVINDGSADRTADIVKSMEGKIPVRLINHEVNKGVGQVFLTGFTIAAKELKDDDAVIIMEADATSDPSLIREMIAKLDEGFDIVCASRYIKGGGYYNFPFLRLMLSRGINLLMHVLFPIKNIRDYSIFFRAYRVGMIKRALEFYGDLFITKRSFASNAEMLLKMRRLGLKGAEVPLEYRYGLKKSSSGIKIFRTISEYVALYKEIGRYDKK